MKELSDNKCGVELSVLMPAHNAQKTIESAIRSALRAMPVRSELIVLLDGCTDSTEWVVRSIQDPRIKLINKNPGVGVTRARQLLLEASNSHLVATLDADDICLPWRFSRQRKLLEKRNLDLIFSSAILFGKGLPFPYFAFEWPARIDCDRTAMALILDNPFVNSSLLARRSALLEIGGYVGEIEDYVLWLKAALADLRIMRTAGWCVCYRIHPGQLSKTSLWREELRGNLQIANLKSKLRSKISRELGLAVIEDTQIETLLTKSSPNLQIRHLGLRKLIKRLFVRLRKNFP